MSLKSQTIVARSGGYKGVRISSVHRQPVSP